MKAFLKNLGMFLGAGALTYTGQQLGVLHQTPLTMVGTVAISAAIAHWFPQPHADAPQQ